jgi:DNA-directed RNA polymerase subunit M/transcription elongation factor TFIIS
MDTTFCQSCDNLLYLYKDDDNDDLYHCCKSCGSKSKVDAKATLVYTTDTGNSDKSESINHNKYITHDVTLPSITNNPTITCRNKDCNEDHTLIRYIKFDDINMKFMYICNHCGCKWKNNL